MKVLINTKSNYKGLNGQWLDVKECVGTRVTCSVYDADFDRTVSVDFSLSEVKEIQYSKQTNANQTV